MNFMNNNMTTDNNSNFDGGYVLQEEVQITNNSIKSLYDFELIPSDNVFIKRANFRCALTQLIYSYTNSDRSAFITDRVLESVEYKDQLINRDFRTLAECIKIEIYRYTNTHIQINEIINIYKQ